jgi:hypothetical protein
MNHLAFVNALHKSGQFSSLFDPIPTAIGFDTIPIHSQHSGKDTSNQKQLIPPACPVDGSVFCYKATLPDIQVVSQIRLQRIRLTSRILRFILFSSKTEASAGQASGIPIRSNQRQHKLVSIPMG